MRARGLQRAGHLGNAPPNRSSPKHLEHGLASARRRRCKVSLVLMPRHIMPEPGATRPAPRHHSPQSPESRATAKGKAFDHEESRNRETCWDTCRGCHRHAPFE